MMILLQVKRLVKYICGGDAMINNTLNKWIVYFTGIEFWESVLNKSLKIIFILILSFIFIRIGNKVIDRIFRRKSSLRIKINEKREQTIKILMKSALTYTIYFIMIVMILESLSIPISTLLAGAGIAGLAIGFGAQSLVRDIISGFFIVFERQFSIDDYVGIAEIEGTVMEIGLRTTKVLSWTGEEHVIPNGNITQVVNYSIYNGMSVVDIHVPYDINIQVLEDKINQIIVNLPNEYEIFTDTPYIQGIRELDLSNYVVRILAETTPASQWQGERFIRKELQRKLYNDGINIPLQQFVIHSVAQKDDFY